MLCLKCGVHLSKTHWHHQREWRIESTANGMDRLRAAGNGQVPSSGSSSSMDNLNRRLKTQLGGYDDKENSRRRFSTTTGQVSH